MKLNFSLTQPQRLASLIVDLCVVAGACWFLFGTAYPPIGDKGFWGYSALLAVLIGSKLVTPFYVKPVDAISYSVPAFISLMLINDWNNWAISQRWGFFLAAGFSLLIFLIGILNIIFNGVEEDWAKNTSNRLRIILECFGHPQIVYAPLIIFAIFFYHLDSGKEVATIGIVLIITVIWSFGDFLVGSFYKIKDSFSAQTLKGVAGQIVAFQEPNIILLRQQNQMSTNKYDLLLVHDKHGPAKLVVVLDYVGRFEGILIRTVSIKEISDSSRQAIGKIPVTESACFIDEIALKKICNKEGISIKNQSNIVGLVAQDTSIERLYFEVVNNTDLEQGRLISVKVGETKVLYQITGGLTKEEIIQQKNTFGYIRGQAQQVGIWDGERFKSCVWLPNINEPVYLESQDDYEIEADSIGHFPKSNYQTKIENINELVTHNTAILGVLGVGKSVLAIELVERMIAADIKVICLDMTNQYREELRNFYDADDENACLQMQYSSEAIHNDLDEFLDPESPWKLKIYNLSLITSAVTPVEITKIISEATLDILSNEMSDVAKVCLVYEEAHSLIPEWNSVVNKGDQNATSGTARAILQGRKYGLGCLLITQRTANVTKTILNQCNSIFAMRTFDDTGKEFLASYIGRDYASALSSIPERHAVFFGRASSCKNPVMIKLNDQNQFRQVFREQHPPPQLSENNTAEGAEEARE